MNSYKVSKLSESAFIEHYNKWVDDCDVFYEHVYHSFIRNIAPYVEVEVDDINWSGFFSQGDGASFSGLASFKACLELLDADHKLLFLRAAVDNNMMDSQITIYRIGHHVHSRTMRIKRPDFSIYSCFTEGLFTGVEVTEETETAIITQLDVFCEGLLLPWLRGKADELYADLEREYEYQTKKESFIEWAESNDILFTDLYKEDENVS